MQSVARPAAPTKARSKFYVYSLNIVPSKAGVSIAKCTLRWRCGKAARSPPLLKQEMYPLFITLGIFKESLLSAPLVVYTKMRETKQIMPQNTLSVKIKYIVHFICKENGRMKIPFKDFPVTVWLDSRQILGEIK